MHPMLITMGAVQLRAELNQPPAAQAIWNRLPVQGSASAWGDAIYFSIPVALEDTPAPLRQVHSVAGAGLSRASEPQ